MEFLFFVLLWVIPALFVVYVIDRLAGPTAAGMRALAKRFAAGEIDEQEYEAKRKALKRLRG